MGRGSSGNTTGGGIPTPPKSGNGGLKPNDFNGGGVKMPKELYPLVKMGNPAVYKAAKEAISRAYAILGAKQRDVQMGDLGNGIGGVHFTVGGKSDGVILNSRIFMPKKATTQSVAAWAQSGYKSGHLTHTNKPVAHIITHELAHSVWTNHFTAPNAVAAGKKIEAMYRTWSKDPNKSGYGKYADSNINEFWAEVCTKAVHGSRDKYTKRAKQIIRTFGL